MHLYVLFLVLPLSMVLLLMPGLIDFLVKRNVADAPGGRKIHTRFTPSLGGGVVYLAFAASMLAAGMLGALQVNLGFLLLLTALCLMGIVDDLFPVRAMYKFVVQMGVSLLFCLLMGERITAIYGFEHLLALPVWAQYLLTVIAMAGITNAYNLSDGIDGLAGGIAASSLGFLSFWFYGVGDITWTFMCISLLTALLGFLAFNWSPAKIFLGDTGSLVIGFFLASAVVHLMDVNHHLPSGSLWKHPATMAMGMSLVVYPLFDTLRVFYMRMRQGRSPFSPDKRHLHHLMLRSGFAHRKIAKAVLLFSMGVQSMVLLLGSWSAVWPSLLGLLAACLLFFYWIKGRLYHFMDNRPRLSPAPKPRIVERGMAVKSHVVGENTMI